MAHIVKSAIPCLLALYVAFGGEITGGWRGLVPLHSNRADVERLLGQPAKTSRFLYETKDEWVYVLYSGKPCDETVEGAWNVPPDTVLRIRVTPKKHLPLNTLRIVEGDYEKVTHPHISGRISYVNEKEGISIESEHEVVVTTYYGPKLSDKHLSCND